MNRRIPELTKIVQTSPIPISTIVNPFCNFGCAYRTIHYNFMAFRDNTDQVELAEYFGARCGQMKVDNPVEILKIPWIRPDDIPRYEALGIHWFKIN